MSHQDIFHKACLSGGLGPRVDIENFPHVPAAPAYAHTRQLAHELIESARQMFPKLPPIYFDFVERGDVNAWAFRVGDTYFIAMTAGAMSMLHLIVGRIMANPKLFPMVGKPEDEDPNLPPVPWNIPNAERLFHVGVRPISPKNKARALYAVHLADQALMFLLGHEIAHITRGHVDYLNATTGSPFLAELGWSGTAQGRLERQALEADADRRSVRARCYSAVGTAHTAGDKYPPWATAVRPDGDWQFDWAFAVNTLFRLFGDPRFSGTNLESQPYPPLPLRRKLAMDTAITILRHSWGAEHEEMARKVMVAAVTSTEKSFKEVGAPPSDGGMADAETVDAVSHIAKIRETWEKVQPALQQYSYEPLADGHLLED